MGHRIRPPKRKPWRSASLFFVIIGSCDHQGLSTAVVREDDDFVDFLLFLVFVTLCCRSPVLLILPPTNPRLNLSCGAMARSGLRGNNVMIKRGARAVASDLHPRPIPARGRHRENLLRGGHYIAGEHGRVQVSQFLQQFQLVRVANEARRQRHGRCCTPPLSVRSLRG